MGNIRAFKNTAHSLFFRVALSALTLTCGFQGLAVAKGESSENRLHVSAFNNPGDTSKPFFYADLPDGNASCENVANKLINANIIDSGSNEYLEVRCKREIKDMTDDNATGFFDLHIAICSKNNVVTVCLPWIGKPGRKEMWRIVHQAATKLTDLIENSNPVGKDGGATVPIFEQNKPLCNLEI